MSRQMAFPCLTSLFLQKTASTHFYTHWEAIRNFFCRNKSASSNVATGISSFCFCRYFHRKESLQSDTWSSPRGPPEAVALVN